MEYISKKSKNISAEVLAGNTDLFFSFQVPSGAKMCNLFFANYINEFDAWGFITWILKRNGRLISPYNAIQDQIAFGAPLRELAGVEIAGGDLFEIYIKNEYVDVVKCGIAIKYEIWDVN